MSVRVACHSVRDSRVCDNGSFPRDTPTGSPVSTRHACLRKQKVETLEGRNHVLIGQRGKGLGFGWFTSMGSVLGLH